VTRRAANVVLAVLIAAAFTIVVIELAVGALDFGEARLADPCTSKPQVSEGGFFGSIDAAVQRFALSGLNGAACELHTTREELVLSFVPSAETKKIKWSKATIERALRSGMRRAGRDTVGGGVFGDVVAFILDNALARPIAFFLGQVAT
jgi:hypothetical protein